MNNVQFVRTEKGWSVEECACARKYCGECEEDARPSSDAGRTHLSGGKKDAGTVP
jgi:hypothetical protein